MLTGIHATFIGGDARQLEVIRHLHDLDATIQLIGYDNLQYPFSGVTKTSALVPEALKQTDALILPPVGTDDMGRVVSIFSSQDLMLRDEHVAMLPDNAKVYTGMAKPYLKQLCARHSIGLVELFDRDDVAIYNSIPTAEGALMMAIQNTDFTIHDSRSIVLGFGRTGFTMARVLKGIGSRVRVGVRRPEHFARAWEMGFQPFYTVDLPEQAADVDLIFNTIPNMIITAQVIAKMPTRAVIIDLASKPGGTDFRFAEKRGIKALLAPSLPGIVAPKTAGKIIAQALIELLSSEAEQKAENGRNGK